MKTIQEALAYVQKHLKAPKNQYNSFGKYKYRNCEDILMGLKLVMPDGASVVLRDDIELIGDRYYLKATAEFRYLGECIAASAYAREPSSKKGMDESQVTGAASSYSRKYALHGLFAIDDNEDADAQAPSDPPKPSKPPKEAIGNLAGWFMEDNYQAAKNYLSSFGKVDKTNIWNNLDNEIKKWLTSNKE